MKVLLINFSDVHGGAAMAAVRLVTALNESGIYARLGVPQKKSSNPYVIELPPKYKNKIVRKFTKLSAFISKGMGPITQRLPKPFSFKTTNGIAHTKNYKSQVNVKWINNSEFDVVNLHWINDVISNKDIAKITKPIVWTMHDSWPCCGAEHHPNIAENDTRWKEGYYKKNKPKTTRGYDLCRHVWKQKKKYLQNKNMTFIAPSKWEHDVLKSSFLFNKNECQVIPNIIDNNVFYPHNKTEVRKMFNIPDDKFVIGFGAAYDIDNPKSMKGSYYLIEALKKIMNPEKYFLVIFGPVGDSFTKKLNINYFASGFISNPNILSCIYSACDCFVNPSLIENLPTTSLESIFCGTPVVSFNVGGSSDIVVHKETGWLATPYKSDELVEGIEWCINNIEELSKNCIKKSINEFNKDDIIQKTVELYSKVLQ